MGLATLVSFTGLVGAIASFAFSAWLSVSVFGAQPTSNLTKGWIITAGVPLLLAAGYARRILARRAMEITEQQRGCQPILFLRCFTDDDLVVGSTTNVIGSWRQDITLEEQITKQLAPAGPIIAIGRPGELLPPLGAARLWLRDDTWQQAVDILLEECRLVIMVMGDVGRHEGLAWEVQRIVQAGCLKKLLLVMPPIEERLARSRWNRFADLLPGGLPGYRRGVLFARFVADDSCEILASPIGERVPNIYEGMIVIA